MAHTKLEPRLFLSGEFLERYSVTLTGQTEVEIPTTLGRVTSWWASKKPAESAVPFYEVYCRVATSGSTATVYVWCCDAAVTDDVVIFGTGTN